MTIFDFDSYVDYINRKIEMHAVKRGYQSELARAAKCQTSYFSAVLQRKVFLTLEQASALCDYWSLSETESEYFLGLVSLARAGSNSLKNRIHKRLRALQDQGRDIGTSLQSQRGRSKTISAEDQSFFHQSWLCAAVYGATRVMNLKTAEDMSRYLNLPVETLEMIMSRLERMGLLEWQGDRWHAIENTVLTTNLVDHMLFHSSLQERARFKHLMSQNNDLRYSFIGTSSLKNFEKLKTITREGMYAQMDLLRGEDQEEVLVGFCYDVFLV